MERPCVSASSDQFREAGSLAGFPGFCEYVVSAIFGCRLTLFPCSRYIASPRFLEDMPMCSFLYCPIVNMPEISLIPT